MTAGRRGKLERALGGRRGGIGDGDGLDLDPSAFGERGHLDGGAGGLMAGKIGGVHVVHGGEIAEVDEENRCLYDIGKGHFVRFQDRAEVVQDEGGLLRHVAFEQVAGDGVEGDLARAKEEVPDGDGLRVRADGLGGIGGGNDFSGHGRVGEGTNPGFGVNRPPGKGVG